MDAAGDLRHGAARDLAVVAAVRVLKHELELVRILAVSCCVRRGDDVADGRLQFVSPGVVRVRPAVLAGDARQHLIFHRLTRRVEPHGRAGPGVNDGVALRAYIKPSLDGRGAGYEQQCCDAHALSMPLQALTPLSLSHSSSASVLHAASLHLLKSRVTRARRLGGANYHTSPS